MGLAVRYRGVLGACRGLGRLMGLAVGCQGVLQTCRGFGG